MRERDQEIKKRRREIKRYKRQKKESGRGRKRASESDKQNVFELFCIDKYEQHACTIAIKQHPYYLRVCPLYVVWDLSFIRVQRSLSLT